MKKGELAKTARAGEKSLVARRAQATLLRRGVRVSLHELGQRTVAECIDASAWAQNFRPLALRPAWLGELVFSGKARLAKGVCSGCARGDRSLSSRVFVVAWADETQTLCVDCVSVGARAVRKKGLVPE
jgi:hypothetical protein